MNGNRDRIFLERIIESIQRIERFVTDLSEASFSKSEVANDAVLMQLINIGEMVNQLSKEFREKNHNFPWYEVIGMRNQIAHGYFEIKSDVIWRTCQIDLPELKNKIQLIIDRS